LAVEQLRGRIIALHVPVEILKGSSKPRLLADWLTKSDRQLYFHAQRAFDVSGA